MPATVPGSARYWKNKWLDLVAAAQEIGMPHYFVTLTANDSWLQLKACLASVRSVIRPVETTQYFIERFGLMKDLLYGKSVFGIVTDHWYRIEFQNRGAPHVHMLLWVAPEFRDNKVVVATLPNETQNNVGRLLKE